VSSHAGPLYGFPLHLFPLILLKIKKQTYPNLGKNHFVCLDFFIFSAGRLWSYSEFYRKDARTGDQLMLCELAENK